MNKAALYHSQEILSVTWALEISPIFVYYAGIGRESSDQKFSHWNRVSGLISLADSQY